MNLSDDIRKLYQAGYTINRIARTINLSYRQVHNRVKGIARKCGPIARQTCTEEGCNRPPQKHRNGEGRLAGTRCLFHFRLADAEGKRIRKRRQR